MNITAIRHPDYYANMVNYQLYRDVYVGGQAFINKYLERYSLREREQDFINRRNMTHCPAISKANVIKIRNAIMHRLPEVKRVGGSKSYQEAIHGDAAGVDRSGSNMNNYQGKTLNELLPLGKVGTFIDHPKLGEIFTIKDKQGKRPYLYNFKAEDILGWEYRDSSRLLEKLLLREHYLAKDEASGLSYMWACRYRFLYLNGNKVTIELYDEDGTKKESISINIPEIPFHIYELSESVLTDIAQYQVTRLNLSSSNCAYALKSNFPFYTEQEDPKNPSGSSKPASPLFPTDTAANTQSKEVNVGITAGRTYPIGAERPGFINPSSEPLEISMKLEDKLDREVEMILSLTLASIKSVNTNQNQTDDRQNLESGLNAIGAELEAGERRIAHIWSLYESDDTPITISYPRNYSLKTDKQRLENAKELNDLKSGIPSRTFQRETGKMVAIELFQGRVAEETLSKIEKEIDAAKTMTSKAEDIKSDAELGLVSNKTASEARGYPPGEVEEAKKDQADRLAMIQAAQTANGVLKNPGSRGVNDGSVNPGADAALEKKAATEPDGSITQRGEGK